MNRFIKTAFARIGQAGRVLLGYRPAEVRFDAGDTSIAEMVAEQAANVVYSFLAWEEDLEDSFRLHAAARVAAFLAVRRYASFDTLAASPEELERRFREERERMVLHLEWHRRPRLYRPNRKEEGDDDCA